LKKNIVLIELHQETNSFSQVPTTIREFESLALYYGDDVINLGIKKHKRFQLAGFIKAVKKFGQGQFNLIPTVTAWATSGGPVEIDVYLHFKAYILERMKEVELIDGVYMSMHGAMGVEGMRDPESDLIRAVRAIVGDQIAVGVSYDLHANITQDKVRLATFINSYRTNPHRDHFSVGYKAARLLMDTINGKVSPVMAVEKMPLLKGGGFTIDFLNPMARIFRKMKAMEKRPKVLSVSNFMVHIWLDDEELGWCTLAVTDGDQVLAKDTAHELAELNWEVRDKPHPVPYTIEEAIKKAKRLWLRRLFGTLVFCDTSDIVAAGAPGENTFILSQLLSESDNLTSYIPLRDKEVASVHFETPIGTTIKLNIGSKLETTYNEAFQFDAKLIRKTETDFGKTLVFRHQKLSLVVTELPCPAFWPSFFTTLGLSLWKADIVVVKNLFPFRLFYALYNRKTLNVATAGTTNLDVHQLAYTKIPRPIYPLDAIQDWKEVKASL